MIRNVIKFTRDMEFYECIPTAVFNVVNTETKELVEDDVLKTAQYHLFHNGQDSDMYKRVVNLRFVDVCEADSEDDLSIYGFKSIGQRSDGSVVLKRWVK